MFERIHASGFAGAALLVLAGAPSAQDLAITEVCDGTLTGGQPKWVEITNVGTVAIADLSAYSLGLFNNGSSTLLSGAATSLNSVPLAIGASYVVALESSGNTACDPAMLVTCFEFVYGSPPDQFASTLFNGDDAVALYLGAATGSGADATLVDVYGQIGIDGTGSVWEYTDSHAYRCGSASLSTWIACDWAVPGVNFLETGDDATELVLLQALTTPFSHAGCVPGPCHATSYCVPKTSSNGCNATIVAQSPGMPTSGANDFTITATGVEETVAGLFFLSIFGANNIPFQGGTLCITPYARTSIGGSVGVGLCNGALPLVVNDPGTPWGNLGTPGTDVWYQCFYRDSGSPGGLGLSNAMYVQYQ